MKKILFGLILITLVLSITLVGYMTEEKLEWNENWPKKIRIGSGPIGAGFYMCGSALANVLQEEFPQLEVIVEQTKAAVHNLKLIEVNEVEFAMTTTDTATKGWIGQEPFGGIEHKGFRVMMPVQPNPINFIFLKKSGITNIKQFTGKFSGIYNGSAADVIARKTIEAFGNKAEVINLALTDTLQALKNGIISGYCLGYPNPATQDLSMQVDLQVLGIAGEDAEKFIKLYPEYAYPLTIPGGYYKGLDEPIEVVGFYTIAIVRDDLPEDMVYTVLKAMYKHIDIVKNTWPIFEKCMKTDAIKGISSPLHKGSIKYYREIGAEIQEKAILDE
jgi:TRAP transporter TAXI family solute receptor